MATFPSAIIFWAARPPSSSPCLLFDYLEAARRFCPPCQLRLLVPPCYPPESLPLESWAAAWREACPHLPLLISPGPSSPLAAWEQALEVLPPSASCLCVPADEENLTRFRRLVSAWEGETARRQPPCFLGANFWAPGVEVFPSPLFSAPSWTSDPPGELNLAFTSACVEKMARHYYGRKENYWEKIRVCFSPGSPCFAPIAVAYAQALRRLGWGGELVAENRPGPFPGPTLCFWNGMELLPEGAVVLNFDPLTEHIRGLLGALLARSSGSPPLALLNYRQEKTEDGRLMGLPLGLLRYGYARSLVEDFERLKSEVGPVEEDIDVLYYGNVRGRRLEILDGLRQIPGLRLCVRNNDCYDEKEKTSLILRAKIVLAINSDDVALRGGNDMARLAYLLSNARFVVSERAGDEEMEEKLTGGLVYAAGEKEIVRAVKYYLPREEQRKKVAEQGRLLLQQHYDFVADMARAVQWLKKTA